jgi:hypothetical protein
MFVWLLFCATGDLTMDFADLQEYLHNKFGKIIKLGGLLSQSDLVYLFDPEDIKKVNIFYLFLCGSFNLKAQKVYRGMMEFLLNNDFERMWKKELVE